jgi:hypothetical protein
MVGQAIAAILLYFREHLDEWKKDDLAIAMKAISEKLPCK